MSQKSRPFDIYIRLPEPKKYIKKELEKIAKRNGITITHLTVIIFEEWLERKDKSLTIKLR